MNTLDFQVALKYPFNRAKGMLNIFWVLLPIVGWFALGGYGVRIVQEFSKGQFKELPVMKFGDDLGLGFFMFLKAIPFWFAYGIFFGLLGGVFKTLGMPTWSVSVISALIALFILPMLAMNFMNKETVGSFFEFNVVKPVFSNLGDYIVAMLKSLLLAIIFAILSIVLVGIPANAFTKNIFIADFYRRRVK